MRLIPRAVRYWRASNLARRQFLEQSLHHTAGATGMLIFVSEAERYVEILVDQGIASQIDNAVWNDIIATFTKQVKQGQTLQGFLTCIRSEEHTSELQSRPHLVCRLLLEKKNSKQ